MSRSASFHRTRPRFEQLESRTVLSTFSIFSATLETVPVADIVEQAAPDATTPALLDLDVHSSPITGLLPTVDAVADDSATTPFIDQFNTPVATLFESAVPHFVEQVELTIALEPVLTPVVQELEVPFTPVLEPLIASIDHQVETVVPGVIENATTPIIHQLEPQDTTLLERAIAPVVQPLDTPLTLELPILDIAPIVQTPEIVDVPELTITVTNPVTHDPLIVVEPNPSLAISTNRFIGNVSPISNDGSVLSNVLSPLVSITGHHSTDNLPNHGPMIARRMGDTPANGNDAVLNFDTFGQRVDFSIVPGTYGESSPFRFSYEKFVPNPVRPNNAELKSTARYRTVVDFSNTDLDEDSALQVVDLTAARWSHIGRSVNQFDDVAVDVDDPLFVVGAHIDSGDPSPLVDVSAKVGADSPIPVVVTPVTVEYLSAAPASHALDLHLLASHGVVAPSAATMLEEALLDFLAQIDDIGRELTESLADHGWVAWAVGIGVGLASFDLARRRHRRFRTRLPNAHGDPDPVYWFPGLPGPFSTQVT